MVKKTRKVLRFVSNHNKLEVVEEVEPPKEAESKSKFLTMVSFATEMGFSISLPIAGGAILGQFLDGKLGTAPKMTLSLIFVGLFIGATNIYFIMKESSEE